VTFTLVCPLVTAWLRSTGSRDDPASNRFRFDLGSSQSQCGSGSNRSRMQPSLYSSNSCYGRAPVHWQSRGRAPVHWQSWRLGVQSTSVRPGVQSISYATISLLLIPCVMAWRQSTGSHGGLRCSRGELRSTGNRGGSGSNQSRCGLGSSRFRMQPSFYSSYPRYGRAPVHWQSRRLGVQSISVRLGVQSIS
jgi:hypothetical protein